MMYGFDMVLTKPPLLNLVNSAVPTYVSYHTVTVFPANTPPRTVAGDPNQVLGARASADPFPLGAWLGHPSAYLRG